MKLNKDMTGLIGESYTIMRLAQRNIKAINLPSQFDYDLILSNGLKIEVKTAIPTVGEKKYKQHIYKWLRWFFHNQKIKGKPRNRECDFYVFICLDNKKEVLCSFIIPSKIIGLKQGMSISLKHLKERKGPYIDYLNNWDLIA